MLFFDAGPIISLIISRMSFILPDLKEKFGGKFYITPAVRLELVERPLTTRRFQFEALQVMKLLNDGVLEVYDKVPQKKVTNLIALANNSFEINGKTMDIIQSGEMESVACALELGASVVMDERTLRLFIENPSEMSALLESRFQNKVTINKSKVKDFQKNLQGIPIIRSIELVSVAFKMSLFDSYLPKQKGGQDILVGAILWATKYSGCAATDHEVEEIKKLLLK